MKYKHKKLGWIADLKYSTDANFKIEGGAPHAYIAKELVIDSCDWEKIEEWKKDWVSIAQGGVIITVKRKDGVVFNLKDKVLVGKDIWEITDISEEKKEYVPLGRNPNCVLRLYRNNTYLFQSIQEVEPYIVPKEWEVTAFIGVTTTNKGVIHNLKKNGKYSNRDENGVAVYEDYHVPQYFNILSVRRLSDGEEFKVGDKFKYKFCGEPRKTWTITEFRITSENYLKVEGRFSASNSCSIHIADAQKVLLTTEDGVDLVKWDVVQLVSIHTENPSPIVTIVNNPLQIKSWEKDYKCFSTLEKAKEYIESKKKFIVSEEGTRLYVGDAAFVINKKVDNALIDTYKINDYVIERGKDFTYWVFSTREAAEKHRENQRIMITSEDGIVLREGDKVYPLRKSDFHKYRSYSLGDNGGTNGCWMYFSTGKAREEYIDKNTFTSHDGVKLKKGDKLWAVSKYNQDIHEEGVSDYKISNKDQDWDYWFFSSKEKAEEYVLWNKPCLSAKEVSDFIKKENRFHIYDDEWLELAKSKQK